MTLSPENGRVDGEIEKPKHKHPTFIQNLSKYFTEYCDNTGIHGFKYIGEPGRLIFERIWWITVFSFSLYLCIDLILATYRKWDTSPVIVSFAQSPTPVWGIPFPAVTICSETKSRQTQFNFTEAYHQMKSENISEEVLKHFEKVALVCDNHLYHGGNKTTGLETLEYLKEIAPPFYDTLWQCKWTNRNETCDHMFSPMLTEEGMCFTFNMLDREELLTNVVYLDENYLRSGQKTDGWTLEGGYPADSEKDTYPRRAMSAGTRAGLVILMRAYQQDLDYICRGPVQGFKILLHNPMEIPRVSTQYFRAPLNQEVVVSIRPDMITTSEGLKNYDPHRRKCYLQSERHLLFFKGYTQQNCQLECLTNYTLKRCDCVAYHMPHDEATPICGSGSIECMRDAEDELLEQEVKAGLSKNSGEGCDCLPSCTSITYNAETSQADFRWIELFNAYKANVSEFPGVQMTRLTISFKEMQFITSERNELYGSTDFLANCGGLLGLFTGFSFLSTIEIIYFLTLRLFCNIKKFGRHFWSGSPELLNNDVFEKKAA